MGIESFKQNVKTTKEGEEKLSTLPINIVTGEKHAEGGESDVWKIKAEYQKKDETGIQKAEIALKQSKRESFATDEEMQKSKKFYEFLKNFPGFGKFVPDTLYFKAQETRDADAQSFSIQKLIQGERIDRLKDDAIYKDPEVVNQLLELVNASIELLHTTRENKSDSPDFMRTPEFNSPAVIWGATVLDPRYSSNIVIADKPNENGQRVFFVDAGVNARARLKMGWEYHARNAVSKITEFQLKKWKNKLEKIHASLSK